MRARTTGSEPFLGDDLLSVLVEAVFRLIAMVALAIFGLLKLAVRYPALLVVGALAAGAGVWLESRAWIAAIVLAGLLALWFALHRTSLKRMVAEPLAGVPRVIAYRFRWPGVVRQVGLLVRDVDFDARERQSRALRLGRVRIGPSGVDQLHVRLPVGMVPADVQERAEALAHAFGCLSARVLPDRPKRLWIELVRRDPLAATVTPMTARESRDLAAVPVGRQEDGSTWTIRIAGTHLLVAGATGAGKSSVLWSLVHALAEDIDAGRVQVWAVDPKGGMELRPGRPLFARFEDASPEDMCTLLEDLVTLKDQRAKDLAVSGDRIHVPEPGSPHIVTILDELATLTAFAERSVARRIDNALGLLLTQGRACGITIVAAVQDPGKDIVGWRDLFPTRIALRLDNPIQVAMVLGDGAREMGAKADEISELTPGVAYVRTEGTRTIRRVRAAYLDDAGIAALVHSESARGRPATVTALPSATDTRGEPT